MAQINELATKNNSMTGNAAYGSRLSLRTEINHKRKNTLSLTVFNVSLKLTSCLCCFVCGPKF